MPATILVITRPCDITADFVIWELLQRDGVEVHRFDTADLVTGAVTVRAHLTDNGWRGTLSDRYRQTDLSSVRSIWWRKPSGYGQHSDTPEQAWVAAEAEYGFGGLLSALSNVHWVNHPHRNRYADDKPLQLALASSLGLTVPPTTITNDPATAANRATAMKTIYKPFRAGLRLPDGSRTMLYADAVEADELGAGVAGAAHQFQGQVDCDYSVRLTSVGDRLFGVRIDSPSRAIDWRADHDDLRYRPIDVPSDVALGVRTLNRTLGLTYSASDWVITPDGRWVFLENNPNGQWAWLEDARGPITTALADELIEGAS
ncbi:MvdC/MvdD family ATP grasp protein [Actinoalloteichus caeruleus]|uniref:MvdC/MvdD family ATP grasp protein n=1 Tax=Actinoalloteichus cyanogriseus TaxID=2893586 RepID=UPI003AB03C2C